MVVVADTDGFGDQRFATYYYELLSRDNAVARYESIGSNDQGCTGTSRNQRGMATDFNPRTQKDCRPGRRRAANASSEPNPSPDHDPRTSPRTGSNHRNQAARRFCHII